jgi:hypothetical protein
MGVGQFSMGVRQFKFEKRAALEVAKRTPPSPSFFREGRPFNSKAALFKSHPINLTLNKTLGRGRQTIVETD